MNVSASADASASPSLAPGAGRVNRRRFELFAWVTLGLTLLVIVWGAYVRASGSGAGCGAHWPTCDGQVLPRPKTLEMLVELTHRYTSGTLGLLVVLELVGAFVLFPKRHLVRGAAVASMILMITEGAVGAALVLLEHVAFDTSAGRAVWVSIHLCNTFLLVGALTAVAYWARHDAWEQVAVPSATKVLIALGGAALIAVGVTGAITALGDTLFKAESLARGIADDFSPTAHFLQQLRVAHPMVAVATAVFVLYARGSIVTGAAHPSREAARFSRLVATALVAQLLLGVLNFVLRAPIATQLVHLLLADLAWIAFVLLGAAATTAAAPERRAYLQT